MCLSGTLPHKWIWYSSTRYYLQKLYVINSNIGYFQLFFGSDDGAVVSHSCQQTYLLVGLLANIHSVEIFWDVTFTAVCCLLWGLLSGDFSRYIKCCASKAHMRFDTERLASILGFDTQTLSQEADTSYTGKHVREWTHTLKLSWTQPWQIITKRLIGAKGWMRIWLTFTKYITNTVCTVNMYGVEVVVAGVGGRNPTWR